MCFRRKIAIRNILKLQTYKTNISILERKLIRKITYKEMGRNSNYPIYKHKYITCCIIKYDHKKDLNLSIRQLKAIIIKVAKFLF